MQNEILRYQLQKGCCIILNEVKFAATPGNYLKMEILEYTRKKFGQNQLQVCSFGIQEMQVVSYLSKDGHMHFVATSAILKEPLRFLR